MQVSCNKLWKLMTGKGINKGELRLMTGIGTNTLAKLGRNQVESMEGLMKLCDRLDCDFADICEFVREENRRSEYECDRFICRVRWFVQRIYGCWI